MGGAFTAIFSFAKDLFDMRGKLAAAKRERRDAVATYCEKIADAIEETQKMLQSNRVPHAPCAKMQVYSEQLPEIVGALLPDDYVRDMVEFLENRQTPEELLHLFNEEGMAPIIDEELSEAIGTLRALAESLRATP